MENTKTYNTNNLKDSLSPYLRQHSDNPVWWQELSDDVLNYAKSSGKPLLFSSGYSTCHWCHVMAKDAFSHQPTAGYLNKHFVCVKIDRETHPDIDAWMMSYTQEQTGQGGWPLNVFLTPDMKPVFAMLYAPSQEGSQGHPSLLRILKYVRSHIERHGNAVESYRMPVANRAGADNAETASSFRNLLKEMTSYFDIQEGGLYGRQKFPPHNTLLFLMSLPHKEAYIDNFVKQTLQTMYVSGLHDHLQGGFYRYCVDRSWHIPHFEKMLYDQAMMLINYSVATHFYKIPFYNDVVGSLLKCLRETFMSDDLYVTAHDADTGHKEGLTYLWTEKEIKEVLSAEEYSLFMKHYKLISFEGQGHLMKRNTDAPSAVEDKLLKIRKMRAQPFRDDKIITSWNALTGIGLLMASRYTPFDVAHESKRLFEELMRRHTLPDGLLAHTSLDSQLHEGAYLEDMASMLLFATYLFEEQAVSRETMDSLYTGLQKFDVNGKWYESVNSVMGEIPAGSHDHPYPSSVSMAEAASVRYKILTEQPYNELPFKPALSYDYYNLAALWSRNELPVLSSPVMVKAKNLPVGTIRKRAEDFNYCYQKSCVKITEEQIKEGVVLK